MKKCLGMTAIAADDDIQSAGVRKSESTEDIAS